VFNFFKNKETDVPVFQPGKVIPLPSLDSEITKLLEAYKNSSFSSQNSLVDIILHHISEPYKQGNPEQLRKIIRTKIESFVEIDSYVRSLSVQPQEPKRRGKKRV